MLRDEYLRRLVDEAYVELYLSGNDGARIFWPWRMDIPAECSQNYRDACEKYIIDSDFSDESVTNRDVLDTADRIGAEVATLADVYQDCEGTVDSVLKGVELYEDHPFDGELLIPLQQPYDECYASVSDCGDYFGLGGMKKASTSKKLSEIKKFRSQVGYNVHVHGFGMGVSETLARAVQNDPGLIDSLDYSTPIQSAATDIRAGDERASVVAAEAGAMLVRDLRRLSPYVSGPSQTDATDW